MCSSQQSIKLMCCKYDNTIVLAFNYTQITSVYMPQQAMTFLHGINMSALCFSYTFTDIYPRNPVGTLCLDLGD